MILFLLFSETILATPPLNGLILPGVIRHSILQLAQEWGEFQIEQRTITMDEIIRLQEDNRVGVKITRLSNTLASITTSCIEHISFWAFTLSECL